MKKFIARIVVEINAFQNKYQSLYLKCFQITTNKHTTEQGCRGGGKMSESDF